MRTIRFLLAVGAVLLANACARQPAFKPVASVKQLMQATIQPSSEVLFEAVGTVVSSSGSGTIQLRREIAALGASLGPPWTTDQKTASFAALLGGSEAERRGILGENSSASNGTICA